MKIELNEYALYGIIAICVAVLFVVLALTK